MINTIATVLFYCSFILCFSSIFIYNLHMFQLNSYKYSEHFKWIQNNLSHNILLRTIWVLLVIPCVLKLHYAGIAISIIIFLATAYINRPKEAKKKLVYTPRVKRVLITTGIILLCITALCVWHSGLISFLPALTCILAPAILVLSNFINTPIEKSINNWYINDAKRIISSMPRLVVIGITGSYGKTSAKYYLSKLLSTKYNVLMTPENYNTTLGVVRTIRTHLRATHDIFVCEMGARNVGDIKEICDLVKPKYAMLTAIGPQHLESFKTIENIIGTKFELVDSLPSDGIAFLNYDSEHIKNREISKKHIRYGLKDKDNEDYFATDIQISSKGSSFQFNKPDGTSINVQTKLLGEHNVLNIVGALCVADVLGVSDAELIQQTKKIEGVPHRLQLIQRGDSIIIDDAYNSNPSGAEAALNVLSFFNEEYKILVTPGMIELGDKEDECNFRFGELAAEVCDYVVLVGEKQTESIYKGLISKNFKDEKIFVAASLNQGLEKLGEVSANGKTKVVLLENDLPDNY